MRRDMTRYWWGQSASAFGSVFTAIALPVVAVVYLRASPAQIALISAASTLPVLVLGLPAGVLVDRITRPRHTLMALDTLSALAVGVVALGMAGHAVSIGWLVALALVQGGITVVAEVIYFVHLRQIADEGDIGRARARLQAGEFGAGLVGRLLAGPTIVAFGAAAALGVDAVSYLISIAALLTMRPVAPMLRKPSAGLRGTLRGAAAGARFLMDSDFHRALMVFLVVPVFAAAGTGTLTGPFLLRVIHVPTGAYGLAGALAGLLGLAGSAAAGRVLAPHRNPRLILVAAFTAGTVCGLLLPLAHGPVPVALGCAALGIALPVLFGSVANVALGPVLVADVAEETTGRVIATLQVVAAGATLLGALTGGALGDWIGIRSALWALNLSALTAIALVLPLTLRAHREPVPEAEEAMPTEHAHGVSSG